MIRKIPVKKTMKHIKGHQDKNPFKVLDRWAKLNIQVDLIAKAYWEETVRITLQQYQQRIFGKGLTVWARNQNIFKV